MAAAPDIAARLADGAAAVDDIQTYVNACAVRGYTHPDLTLYGNQIKHWYGMHDGLDLRVLDADAAALRAAGQAGADALDQLRAAVGEISGAWSGGGGTAAVEFLRRHCDNAEVLVQSLGIAAGSYDMLRDALWHAVDQQVAGTISVDGDAQRADWLPAAHAVLSGAEVPEEVTAVVDTQLKPFVDTVIGTEWVTVMRTSAAEAEAAYRRAQQAIADCPAVRFELPGRWDIGDRPPAPQPPPMTHPVAATSAPVAPAVPVVPATPETLTAPTVPAAAGGALPDVGAGAMPMPTLPSLPTLSSVPTLPGLGGLDSSGDPGGLPDPPDLPEPDIPELGGGDEKSKDDGEPEPEVEEPEDEKESVDGEAESEEPDTDPEPEPEPEAEPEPEVPAAPTAVEPAPVTPETPTAQPCAPPPAPPPPASPCEIAADELPQAGQ